MIQNWFSPFTISAIYCLSRYILLKEDFDHFFKSVVYRFVAGVISILNIFTGIVETSLQCRSLYESIL